MTSTHPSLSNPPSDLIGGRWAMLDTGGIVSESPAEPGRTVWSGSPVPHHVGEAIDAARSALGPWSRTPSEARYAALRAFAERCRSQSERLAELISDETGKTLWEARAEAGLLASKVDITLDEGEHGGLRRIAGFEFPMSESKRARCWFRPHGVMAVLGPFNFPAHLPNGHIVPALTAGNTVVFKPSDKAPGVGQLLIELLHDALDEAGAPAGVVNLVHGGADTARAIVASDGVDGILFTGSWPVGRRILEANLDRPGRIVALEMGGNNAAVILPDADLRQAVMETARCAYITTGQRCTCTRRLIVHRDVADRVIPAIQRAASNLIVGPPRAEHPVFMGPIISEQARSAVFEFERSLAGGGGTLLLESTVPPAMEGWYLTPSLVRVDRFVATEDERTPGRDVEVFGPLLRVAVVDSVDEAIAQANATRYGLAASIFTRDAETIERFMVEARAGCVNINAGTAGASSRMPFGGLGLSGNHRPAGSFSLDYCAYPVAGMIEQGDGAGTAPGMVFEDDWIA